ncbi:bidirectional sugar transporter SWEET12-like [Herrania umbratica]|uniref:Bidirectional sugar transporter SWEET n=1 Tax=Herrania umbratica TaxID=108875 RepID=A0A6J1AJ03_9ROSI|nr:bidirectional sugar transporter SWEET12-like [Herrania umbratica]
MGVFATDNPWVFISGLLGNISSFVVFLAPLPTFIRVCKKKSTEGFQSVPYVVALFSAMLWMYYAFVKSGAFLLVTINSFGCFVETAYIAIYIAYAPKQARMFTLRILLLMNFVGFCSILLVSRFLAKGSNRAQVLGWICVAFATSVFAAPLSIIRQVIRTKSVEFMPFYLSFFLTLSAITWLLYGIFLKDLYITIPNVLGFIFGLLQMVLYAIYRNSKVVTKEVEVPEHSIDVTKLSTVMNSEVQEMSSEPDVAHDKSIGSCKVQNEHDQREKILEFANPNLLLGKCEA